MDPYTLFEDMLAADTARLAAADSTLTAHLQAAAETHQTKFWLVDNFWNWLVAHGVGPGWSDGITFLCLCLALAFTVWAVDRIISRFVIGFIKQRVLNSKTDIDDILYIHKSLGDTDWYYVISKDNLNTVNIEAVFDLDGRYPEIWDPMDGSVRNCALYTDGVGYTSVPLTLRPKQGVFVVLRKGEKLHVSAIETPDGRSLYPVQDNDWSEEFPAVYQGEDGEFYLEQLAGGSYYVAFSNCTNTRVKVEEAGKVVLDGIEGTMTFEDEPLLGTLPIGGFKDFTKSLNPLIKYYSGTVTYRLEAVLPEDFLNGDRRIRISIPAFGSTASLEINGHRLETIWDPSFMADITEYVRKGANELKIVVTNPWRNRLTGDKAGIPSSRKLWTTSPLQQKHIPPQQIIHEYTKLYPAGISRPITIYAVEKTLL